MGKRQISSFTVCLKVWSRGDFPETFPLGFLWKADEIEALESRYLAKYPNYEEDRAVIALHAALAEVDMESLEAPLQPIIRAVGLKHLIEVGISL